MSFIFISYSRQDQAYVDMLVQALESHRLPVWMDQRIDYGSRWTREIEDHLERCQVFLLVMSPRSKESDWVDRELTWALKRKKQIFPLLLEGEHWFRVVNIQATNVIGDKLPPAQFFEAVRAYFPTRMETAESLSVQAVAVEEIPAAPAPVSAAPKMLTVQPSSLWRTYPFETVRVNEWGDIIERSAKEAYYFVEELGNGLSLEMVRIPGDEFVMGASESENDSDDSEKPQHWVAVPEFCIGKFPITQAQYDAVVGQNPSQFKGTQRPVENVSWQDVVAFCKVLSEQTGQVYRLPSEAEWEYACRAGTAGPFHFGGTITPDIANYDGKYTYGQGPKGKCREQTTVVGSFQVANQFGLYDMHGNVCEWCQDTWHSNYAGAPTNGSAWVKGGNQERRVLRGGSWFVLPRHCRSAFRSNRNPGDRNVNFGFRVVCPRPRDP